MTINRYSLRPVKIWLVFGLLLLLSLACNLIPAQRSIQTPSPTRTESNFPIATTPALTRTALPPIPTLTEVAVIEPDAQVRRLIPAVFAGNRQPLPELQSGTPASLDPGGLVSTDLSGEAEVVIQGCLKIFVFQDTSLERNTCRKQDVQAGLGVCSTAGLTGVLNNCLSQVNIQTPSGTVQTSGTWFTVLYLPADQLSIVQVYEGQVDVQAVVNERSGEQTGSSPLKAGNLWFSAPGIISPDIAGIAGRQPQPIEVWEAMRPELIQRYPYLDIWMQAVRDRAQSEGLFFPEFLPRQPGQVTLELIGSAWNDWQVRHALTIGFDWLSMSRNNWPDANIAVEITYQRDRIADARQTETNPQTAQKILLEGGIGGRNIVYLMVAEGDSNSYFFATTIQEKFKEMGIESSVIPTSEDQLKAIRDSNSERLNSNFILIRVGGSNFENF